MPRDSTDFERFTNRVHRRYVALRLLEQTGLGLLAGCTAGLPLVFIAFWRALPADTLAIAALALGAVAGFLHGWLARPTPLQTALEADRQLDTADLLSSAWSMRETADPWAQAMRSSADSWSRATPPSKVILNRLGARAWGGIGLATALLVVLAMLPTYANPTQAAEHSSSANRPPDERADSQSLTHSAARARTSRQHDPEDRNATHIHGGESATPPNPSSTSNASADADHPSAATDPNGRGRAESHSESNAARLPDAANPTGSNDASSHGRSASGTGKTGRESPAPGSISGQNSASSDPLAPAPPWRSAQWPQDINRANRAVESGQVPDQYRDVIRGYFERP